MTDVGQVQQPILKVNTRYYRVEEFREDGIELSFLPVNGWTEEGEHWYTYHQLGRLLSDRSDPTVRFFDELPEEVN